MPDTLHTYLNDKNEAHTVDVVHQLAQHTQDAFLVTAAEPFARPKGPEVVYVNPAFSRMTGYTQEDIIGQTPRILQSDATDKKELGRIRRALEAWAPVRAVLLNNQKTGAPFWVELDIVPIADNRGWYTHWASIQRDVTERVENEKRLAKALDLAEQAAATKASFLATVSHELRTPLNAIIGFSDVLEREILGPHAVGAYRNYSSDIRRSGEHLLDLVNDLLTVSEAAGKSDLLDLSAVSLTNLFERVLPMVRQRGNEMGVAIHHGPLEANLTAITNDRAARQIIINLVTNAVKASPPSTPVLIDLRKAPDGNFINLSVRDQGQGIPDDVVRHLGKEFKLLRDAYVSRGSGFGLGLAIVDRVCRATGAKIGFEKPPSGGTVVTVKFPTAKSSENLSS